MEDHKDETEIQLHRKGPAILRGKLDEMKVFLSGASNTATTTTTKTAHTVEISAS